MLFRDRYRPSTCLIGSCHHAHTGRGALPLSGLLRLNMHVSIEQTEPCKGTFGSHFTSPCFSSPLLSSRVFSSLRFSRYETCELTWGSEMLVLVQKVSSLNAEISAFGTASQNFPLGHMEEKTVRKAWASLPVE